MLAWNDEIWVEDFSVGNETYTGCYNAITHLVSDIAKFECGSEILSTMTSKGYQIAAVSTEQHLGSYSNLLSAIPGYQSTIMTRSMASLKQRIKWNSVVIDF